MNTFIVSILILLIVAPTALVLGLRLAWFVLKKIFQRGLQAVESWLIKHGL